MTDNEINDLCAMAMGWQRLGPIGVLVPEDERRPSIADEKYKGQLWCLSGQNDWWKDPEGRTVCGPCQKNFYPLTDAADAMAMVKKLKLGFNYDDTDNGWKVVAYPYHRDAAYGLNFDLNRAICECVVQLQSAPE